MQGETVERVARHLRQKRFDRTFKGMAGFDTNTPLSEAELEDAKAAISETLRAIREPTPEMVEAMMMAPRFTGGNGRESCASMFKEAIDSLIQSLTEAGK